MNTESIGRFIHLGGDVWIDPDMVESVQPTNPNHAGNEVKTGVTMISGDVVMVYDRPQAVLKKIEGRELL